MLEIVSDYDEQLPAFDTQGSIAFSLHNLNTTGYHLVHNATYTGYHLFENMNYTGYQLYEDLNSTVAVVLLDLTQGPH